MKSGLLLRCFFFFSFSAHGTFLGQIRLEPHKPQQVPLDSTMSFGVSTRIYVLREKPQTQDSAAPGELKAGEGEDEELKHLLGLPEEETELNVRRLSLCFPQLVLSRVLKKSGFKRGSFISLQKPLNVSNPKLQMHLKKKKCISWNLTKLKIDSCKGIHNL